MGLLSEPERLRVVSALALGARKPGDVLAASGLPPRDLARALRRLESGGLVSTVDGELVLNAELFKDVARAAAPPESAPEDLGVEDPKAAAVLRRFLRGGRLAQLPATRTKRLVILEHLAAMFEPGVRYAEKEVNAILRAWHDDYVSLRRYLVDERLLDREHGHYWRIGGWVDTTPAEPVLPVRRQQRVAAYAVVRDSDGSRVLLSRLSRGVHAGLWTLPGGRVDFGERPADAVRREVREETGYLVRVSGLLDVDSELLRYERGGERIEAHPVRVVYAAAVEGGELAPETDGSTDDARWWHVDDLRETELTPYAHRYVAFSRE